MFIKIYKKILSTFAFLTVASFFLNDTLAAVQSPSGVSAPFSDMRGLITTMFTLARWFEIIVIVFAVIFILVGAFTYVSAGGDSDQVTKAKNYLMYGVIGIIVAATAEGIVRAVASIFGINP